MFYENSNVALFRGAIMFLSVFCPNMSNHDRIGGNSLFYHNFFATRVFLAILLTMDSALNNFSDVQNIRLHYKIRRLDCA